MGADNYSSASSRLVTLQIRKQELEEKIAQRNQELRELCLQEAQITSIMPPEVPLEPGETLPHLRRKIQTAFEYPQNLLTKLNNEKESISALETEIQFQKTILEGASRLAHDASTLKEKRKNTLICEQTKHSIKDMEEKLENLKLQMYGSQPSISQIKQKKKPRPPFKLDLTSLKNNNFTTQNEDINRAYLMHQYQENNHDNEHDRYIQNRASIHNSYTLDPNMHRMSYIRPDYHAYTLERTNYKDHRNSNIYIQNPYPYSQTLPLNTQTSMINTMNTQISPMSVQISPMNTQISPMGTQMNTQTTMTTQINHMNTQISPMNTNMNPHIGQVNHINQMGHHMNTQMNPHVGQMNMQMNHQLSNSPVSNSSIHPHQIPLLTTHPSPTNINYQLNQNYHLNHHIPLSHRMSSPPVTQHISQHLQNINRHSPVRTKSVDGDPRKSMIVDGYTHEVYYPQYHETDSHNNYSPIYHQDPEVVSTGLGGYWIKNENNESIWVSTVSPMNTPPHGHWTRDKRFGSLDRRKEKFTKHIERKNTIVTMSPPEVPTPRNQEVTPLIRTQSLGSVGAQSVDILYPDDNSSYDSDGQSFKERTASMYSRKCKPKGWCETSLDTPPSENNLIEEPHYQPPSRLSYSSPQTPKLLEIPAESNPSPNIIETPTELYNNNLNDLPKNCTVVQAGQFKPYREVTKPFEMEDFYKYSTKFREKKAMKDDKSQEGDNQSEDPPAVQKSIYQPLQPMKCQPYGPPK